MRAATYIHNDIAEVGSVTLDVEATRMGLKFGDKINVLGLGEAGDCFRQAPEEGHEVEVAAYAVKVPRLNLGDLEDLEDHVEQDFATRVGGGEVDLLLIRDASLAEEAHGGEETVKRGSELVRHARDEDGLLSVLFLQLLEVLLQHAMVELSLRLEGTEDVEGIELLHGDQEDEVDDVCAPNHEGVGFAH